MKDIHDYPIFSKVYGSIYEFIPSENSAYIYSVSIEDRSKHANHWMNKIDNISIANILRDSATDFAVQINNTLEYYSLRNQKALASFIKQLKREKVYLDITGINYRVWAPLIKSVLELDLELEVIYVEPADYRPLAIPTEWRIFDLSERIEGIAPIPGFISLNEMREDMTCFVPILGFEGARFAFILEQIQPLRDKIVPIMGVPGFKLEYPFHTYYGNRLPLMSSQSWRNIRYVTANCPFSLFHLLKDIHEEYECHLLKIAPIGTKPHALGAVLYALCKRGAVELIYDHPIRKNNATAGTAQLHVYNISYLYKHYCAKEK